MKSFTLFLTAAALPLLAGCTHNNSPVMMAPPTTPVTINQPMESPGAGGQSQAYNWTEVPAGQQVPIQRAVFDQGGYQLYSQEGTIVVPFANQNLYVMKFGQSNNGGMYFVNNGQCPTLYIPNGGYLDNASQPGAHWYPFPQNYAYTQPVYVGLAPSWSAFSGMGWYPGMAYYGGYWGYNPYSMIGPMVGLHFLIGGSPYYGWNSYHSYYAGHPYGYAPMRVVNRTVYNQAARTSFNGAGGGLGRRGFGSAGSTFGGGRSFGSNRAFGGGSFGGGRSGFGASAPRPSGGSFGSGPSGYGGSFGTGRRSFPTSSGSGSFGGSAPVSRPSFGGSAPVSRPSFGGSFGGGGSFGSRPSSGFFGGGSRSFGGGGSFGGGRSSFGGGRRR